MNRRIILFSAAVVAALFSAPVISLEKTFQWNNVAQCGTPPVGGCWPSGTTVELCVNGLCIPGLNGATMPTAQYRMNIPVDYGGVIDARARAVAPSGYQCGDPPVPCHYSDWSNNVVLTYPSPPGRLAYTIEKRSVMATASDDFERADVNPLAGNWTTLTSQGAMQIVSGNVGSATDGARSGAYYNAQAFSNDHFSEIVIADSVTGDRQGAGPVCRASTSVATFYYVYTKILTGTNDYGIMLRRMLSANHIELARYTTPVALNDVIRLVCNGSTISVTLNGSTVISVTNTEIPNGTHAGVFSYWGNRRIGSWNAGDLVESTALHRRALDGPLYGSLQGSVR